MFTPSVFFDTTKVWKTVEVGNYNSPKALYLDFLASYGIQERSQGRENHSDQVTRLVAMEAILENPEFQLVGRRSKIRIVNPTIEDIGLEPGRHPFHAFEMLRGRIGSLGLQDVPIEASFQLLIQDEEIRAEGGRQRNYPFMKPTPLVGRGEEATLPFLLVLSGGRMWGQRQYNMAIGGIPRPQPTLEANDRILFALPD